MEEDLNKLRDLKIFDPVLEWDISFLEEMYAVMLDVHIWTRPGNKWFDPSCPGFHIWTRPGNKWFDPSCPGFSDRVNRIMQCMEEHVLEEGVEIVPLKSPKKQESKSFF